MSKDNPTWKRMTAEEFSAIDAALAELGAAAGITTTLEANERPDGTTSYLCYVDWRGAVQEHVLCLLAQVAELVGKEHLDGLCRSFLVLHPDVPPAEIAARVRGCAVTLRSFTRRKLDDLLDRGIKANAHAIAEIVADGTIAVVLWETERGIMPHAAQALCALGWDGQSRVFAMSGRGRRTMISSLGSTDPVTVRWLRGHRVGRIFVATGNGSSLLVNFDEERGFSIEPCSMTPRDAQARPRNARRLMAERE